jgi:hypothetical protein
MEIRLGQFEQFLKKKEEEMKAMSGDADVVDDLVLMRSSTIPSDYGNF